MPPLLSIIIPSYNHAHCISAALESVLEQSFQDFEVVLVDDCSDEPYDEIVSTFAQKGMDIRLIRNEAREYTKNSRLNGVESARGKLITFIDADDKFPKGNALAYHVDLILNSNADILHYNCANYENGKINYTVFNWGKPFAERLEGASIFKTYVSESLRGHFVYGKIVTRELWMKCLPAARKIPVLRYQEDLLLCTLLMFHSKSYMGSDRIGYEREFLPKTDKKLCGRAIANYLMLRDFVPYAREHGASQDITHALEAFFFSDVRHYVGEWLSLLKQDGASTTPEDWLNEIRQHTDSETFIALLLSALIK